MKDGLYCTLAGLEFTKLDGRWYAFSGRELTGMLDADIERAFGQMYPLQEIA